MKIDWSLVITLVAALFLSSVVNRVVVPKLFNTSGNVSTTNLQTNANGVLTTGDPIKDYILTHHPDVKM